MEEGSSQPGSEKPKEWYDFPWFHGSGIKMKQAREKGGGIQNLRFYPASVSLCALFDDFGVRLGKDEHAWLPGGGFALIDHGEGHDGEEVAAPAEVGGAAVEADGLGAGGGGNGVSFEPFAVVHVAHENALAGPQVDQGHELGIDREASLVVQAGVGDLGAMDF